MRDMTTEEYAAFEKEWGMTFAEFEAWLRQYAPEELRRILDEKINIDATHTLKRRELIAKQLRHWCDSGVFNREEQKEILAMAQRYLNGGIA